MIRKLHQKSGHLAKFLSRIKDMIINSEPMSVGLVAIDLIAHVILMTIHVTGHTYPYQPTSLYPYVLNLITAYTPWYVFHFIVVCFYITAAVISSPKLASYTVTISWMLWVVWTLANGIWVFSAPVSWVPPVLGLVMCGVTWLARRVWTEKEE